MEVWIYGASDDLIEVAGDLNEEYMATYMDSDVLEVSPLGVKVTVEYGKDAIWRLSVDGDYDAIEHYAPGEHDYKDYSEALRIEGDDITVRRL